MLQHGLRGVLGVDKNLDRAAHRIVGKKGGGFVALVEARTSRGMHPRAAKGLSFIGIAVAQFRDIMMTRAAGGGAFDFGGQNLSIDRGPRRRRPTLEHQARAQPKRQYQANQEDQAA